jgi:hypothetical protein
METDGDIVPCKSCGTPTTFATEIAPLGTEPGHRVYQCPACKRFTSIDWWPSPALALVPHGGLEPPARPVRQQQQQQPQRQSGAKSDDDP